jgi:MFS family permease
MPIRLILLLSTVTFVSMKGSRVAAALFAIELGAGPFATGLIFALYGLGPFLLAVYAGRIADRVGSRVLMYWGLGGFTASLVLPSVLPSLPALFTAAALWGITSMIFVVATQNLIGLLSTKSNRTRNFSLYSLGESTAAVAGPVLVGASIDGLGYPATFLLLALITAGCCALLAARRRGIPDATPSAPASGTRASRDLLGLPPLRNTLITNGIVMTGLDLFNIYMPVYGRGIELDATTIGFIMGAFGVAAFVVRLLIPPITSHWGERAMLAAALGASAAAFVVFPLTTSPVWLALAAFALGLGLGCGQPLSMILAFNAAPQGRSAEAIALRLSVSYGAHVFVPPVFGALGTAAGLGPVFWTCALLLAGGSFLNARSSGRAGGN